jgi:DNA-binding CsgD family transcriptional regulator
MASSRTQPSPPGRPAKAARTELRRALVKPGRSRKTGAELGPRAARERWLALWTGDYTPVDTFVSEGRRYLIAVKKGVSLPTSGLDERELHVLAGRREGRSLSELARELDISVSSCSRALESALTKLGLKSVTDLM